jgi:DNA-directed RNA polymerase specialized sigma24 family protein
MTYETEKFENRKINLGGSYEERRRFAMELYAEENAPVRTSPQDSIKRTDMLPDQCFLEFTIGFEMYFRKFEEDMAKVSCVRRRALVLFKQIMSLSAPDSTILYLVYVRNMDMDSICRMMYMSRATFYRRKNSALLQLKKLIETQEKKEE